MSQPLFRTVPQIPAMLTSTRPALLTLPPASLIFVTIKRRINQYLKFFTRKMRISAYHIKKLNYRTNLISVNSKHSLHKSCLTVYPLSYLSLVDSSGLIVGAFDSVTSGLGLSPGPAHYVRS